MGLFSKKPKPSPPDTTSTPAAPVADSAAPGPFLTAPAPTQSTPPSLPTLRAATTNDDPPPRPAKKSKTKKGTVDPVDFLALRSELMDVKKRLEASEQAKAIVESRLAALDATTTALATERPAGGGDEVRTRLAELQSQLVTVAEAAAAAAAEAETAHAAATAVAAPSAPSAVDANLLARIDALAADLDAAKSAPASTTPDPGLLARLDQLSARLDGAVAADRVAGLEAQLGELAAQVASPPAADSVVDGETQERLEQLTERMGAIDGFAAQLSQLNARVTAQAEFGAQLGSLRDRITELSGDMDDRRAAAFAATGDVDLRDRVNALADRVATSEGLAAQIAQLAERVAATDGSARQSAEQVAAIEQRLNSVSTELANQVSELGRDIDGLAAERHDLAQGNVSDEVVDHLKTAQVKLAAEQARDEIAFREDLAVLAEQVRRPAR